MMALGNMDNDTRGWIMCIVSGMACVAGASIICIDVVVRLIPSQSKFSIQESNGFLASSLSLSFGVMLFSSLYSMLPSSKRYLLEDSWEEQAAGFVMMGLWVAGFVGIQILSRLLHQFMPSHVVDCDHTHGAQPEDETEYLRSHSSPPHAHTVIAIALHKFPEGFVTYATNHANPNLGFNVFMALFVHNIAEGFSMALPLYMALGSRLKAILWSSLLGGLSQPMGAGLAVLWFKLANHSNIHIDNTAYACLFAATAGIMTSVALQLFVESLSLNHNRNLSIFFAFLGMSLMGLSNALVDD
ncbi:hypothetical protein P8C59_003801 [Phyllachora maydis]|uniref:Zinc/iron permease n=1 Tax=Phyllachora maydis TaxID=1825666 RepID=A0AAD9I291_9PEZI|nr:hypothetical protein P8C59_003801 [Phyllachora maydis]